LEILMAVFPITTGLLTATDWRKSIISAGGFFDFTDGGLQCVMLIDDFVSVRVIRRTAVEFFETTIDDAFNTDPRLKLIVNGSYGDNQSLKIILRLAKPGTGPVDADLQEIMGNVIQGGAKVAGSPRPLRAFFAFDHSQRTQAPVCSYGIGDPPTGVDAALGGLGPLVIGNTKFDNRDAWYAALNSFAPQTGRIGIASSIATGLILVFAQPQGTRPGLTVDQLRDKLSDAGFDDAVLLDGSDSVMVMRDGARRISQGPKKNRLTSIGLGFFYEAGSGLPTA
jgi:hypothetical protein